MGAPPAALVFVAPADVHAQPAEEWEVEYAVNATMHVTDTPMGQGDGDYAAGPGRLVLRFENVSGQPGGRARMTAYSMHEAFTVTSQVLVVKTTVSVDSTTRATPNACGSAAEGAVHGRTLTWATPVRGYHSDGTLTCDGVVCGKFGAPPDGSSPMHVGPVDVRFAPFHFAADGRSFTMPRTFALSTDTPKQTAYIELTGRETRRALVAPQACR
jgi:hypothetical protein